MSDLPSPCITDRPHRLFPLLRHRNKVESTEVFPLMPVDLHVIPPRPDSVRSARFEALVLPCLDAAYNLARWLTRHDEEAEDVVQTACLRALRFFDGFQGGNAKSWLLTIVRNTFYSWVAQHRERELDAPFDEEIHTVESAGGGPEAELLRRADAELLRQGFAALPVPSVHHRRIAIVVGEDRSGVTA